MKRVFLSILLLTSTLGAWAWSYDSETATTTHSAQWRMGADFTKKWNNGLRLGISEELRFDLYNSATGPAFRKSFTTVALGYTPVEYVKFDLGYTLKVLGPDSTWSTTKKRMPMSTCVIGYSSPSPAHISLITQKFTSASGCSWRREPIASTRWRKASMLGNCAAV